MYFVWVNPSKKLSKGSILPWVIQYWVQQCIVKLPWSWWQTARNSNLGLGNHCEWDESVLGHIKVIRITFIIGRIGIYIDMGLAPIRRQAIICTDYVRSVMACRHFGAEPFLKQYWIIVKWTIGIHFILITMKRVFQGNSHRDAICKMRAIFLRPQCVNPLMPKPECSGITGSSW